MVLLFLALAAHAHEMPKNLSTDLVFSKDDSILPLSAGRLSELARELKAEPDLVVELRVHSDATGDAAAELATTQRRADILRKWFLDRGVSETQLTGVGLGSSEPMTDDATASGRARNRRVEFKLVRDAHHADEPAPTEESSKP